MMGGDDAADVMVKEPYLEACGDGFASVLGDECRICALGVDGVEGFVPRGGGRSHTFKLLHSNGH